MASTTKKPAPLRVATISVRQVLGLDEFTVEPGQITVASGPNGSGKSSLLTALQAALSGGKLANLARISDKGKATDSEVVIVLQGEGLEEYRITKRGDEVVRVKARVGESAAFAEVPKPQAFLSSLFDAACCSPVRILTAADKDRALLILEALDLKLDRDELLVAMKIDAATLPAIPRGLHPLEEAAMIRAAVFDQRTAFNTSARDKRASAEEIRKGCPGTVPGDPLQAIADLDAETRDLQAGVARDEEAAQAAERAAAAAARGEYAVSDSRVRADLAARKAERRGLHERTAAEMRAGVERRIAALAGEMETEIDGRDTAAERELDDLEVARDAKVEEARRDREQALAALGPRREALSEKAEHLGKLRAQSKEATRVATLFGQVKKFDEQAETLEADAQRLTAALDTLDAYRRRMAQNLPIPGLEIEDKVIRVNGVPFEQLNLAQRTEIAVEVAALRATGHRLPIIFVDDAEKLDDAHFQALTAAIAKRGLQAFFARVTNGPFTVSAA